MKVILIGFAGSGKSTVALELSKLLHLPTIEMDSETLARSGRESINQIFDLDGEAKFRDLESKICLEIKDRDNLIVSCGGGVVIRPENMASLCSGNSVTIYLSAQFETLVSRLKNDSSRPLFRNKDSARKLFEIREPLYKRYANITVEVEAKSVGQIAREIAAEIKAG